MLHVFSGEQTGCSVQTCPETLWLPKGVFLHGHSLFLLKFFLTNVFLAFVQNLFSKNLNKYLLNIIIVGFLFVRGVLQKKDFL